jgi:hypothetical protein
MVFHPEDGKPSYEVGILKANGHDFSVAGSGCRKCNALPHGTRWTLAIMNRTPQAPIPPVAKRHPRRPDDPKVEYDFDWIVDLEGDEFHQGELSLEQGHLQPIIHLPYGEFYTQYKSLDLQRRQGKNGKFVDFGFVPEVTGLTLELLEGQELTLKDDDSGTEILKLPDPSAHPPYIIWIQNVRHPPMEASDFRMYYQLFPDVPRNKQFDFQANKTANRLYPLNPDPSYLARTCCQMACTAVLLSQRKAPLQ